MKLVRMVVPARRLTEAERLFFLVTTEIPCYSSSIDVTH
jgi:hypothetical protein